MWQKELSPLLSEQGWIYYPLDYGWFSVFFFIPGFLRRRKIEWFRKQYQEIRNRYQDVIPSIIAHSFGTWITCKAISKYENLRFDKIILAGSIVSSGLDWKTIHDRNQITAVRNDVGRCDRWARFSKYFAWGTGSSGFEGFSEQPPCLTQRIYPEFSHSSVFGYDHYLNEWIPFLRRRLPFANGELPFEREEEVSPYDAARWSAITYFKQYICRVSEALVRNEVYLEDEKAAVKTEGRLIVLIPRTPGEADKSPIARVFQQRGFRRISFGGPTRRTGSLGTDGCIYDIPTIIHSLRCLDHRGNEELIDAVNEFARTLQERIDDADSGVKGVVEIQRI